MHEMSIAQNILDIVQQELQRHQVPPTDLRRVNVAVGRLSAIVPASLSFCFRALTENTDFDQTSLQVRVVPIGYVCGDCDHRFEAEDMVFSCPECGADQPMIVSGRDMTIENVEVAE
jgi:hydrogenase nickel incorporation protein HypA/HybF